MLFRSEIVGKKGSLSTARGGHACRKKSVEEISLGGREEKKRIRLEDLMAGGKGIAEKEKWEINFERRKRNATKHSIPRKTDQNRRRRIARKMRGRNACMTPS